MEQVAFITGADRGLGLAMVKYLASRNWRVFAGQYMTEWTELVEEVKRYPNNITIVPLNVSDEDSVKRAVEFVESKSNKVDLLINNAGIISQTSWRKLGEEQDFDEMKRVYNINAMGPLRVVEAFLKLTDKSSMKRICFISSEAGSINSCHRQSEYGYCMSKAALNMGVKILFNRIRGEGYTFRLYHPGWIRSYMLGVKNNDAELEPEDAANNAITYFLSERFKRNSNNEIENDEDRLVMRDWKGSEWPW